AILVECGYLSNRAEGYEARSASYRETLADKIAEAIVEERYGSGVYHASLTSAPQQSFPNNVPASGQGPGAAPGPGNN
ncbi:MAG TPA: hypothetical protein VGH08_00315, partial [Chthoniobacterales bacterium]